MGASGQNAELIHQVVAEATSALQDWLREDWILAPGAQEALERAHVQVNRDWYGPYWSVRFTMEDPPWFGDSVVVEVEELAQGGVQATFTEPTCFHTRNIDCPHAPGERPHGHWKVNPSPPPRGCPPRDIQEEVSAPLVTDAGSPRKLRSRRGFFSSPPRDLGWADSRHWMEEE
ncbi:MAG: hypothetical protein ACUVS3_16215 [Thermodesulfobacteriota bacterium]